MMMSNHQDYYPTITLDYNYDFENDHYFDHFNTPFSIHSHFSFLSCSHLCFSLCPTMVVLTDTDMWVLVSTMLLPLLLLLSSINLPIMHLLHTIRLGSPYLACLQLKSSECAKSSQNFCLSNRLFICNRCYFLSFFYIDLPSRRSHILTITSMVCTMTTTGPTSTPARRRMAPGGSRDPTLSFFLMDALNMSSKGFKRAPFCG